MVAPAPKPPAPAAPEPAFEEVAGEGEFAFVEEGTDAFTVDSGDFEFVEETEPKPPAKK